MTKEKEKVTDPLELAYAAIEKEYGKGAIITSGISFPEVERILSGSLALDKALNGGWARGRIIEIFGPESTGKTTVALHAIAQAQKANLKCVFIDAEHALDGIYAKDLGVDLDQLIFCQPDNGEMALNITETLIRSGKVGLIVIDSVAALAPRAEIEGDIGDSHMGLQARMMSQALRKFSGIVKKTNTTIIFINQLRSKIGIVWGNPSVTTGGNALKFYASQRIEVKRVESIKSGEEIIANKVRVKVVKSKVGRPFRIAEFQIGFGKGIDSTVEIFNLAKDLKIINKAGSWYDFNGERWQGEATVLNALETNPTLLEDIKGLVDAGM